MARPRTPTHILEARGAFKHNPQRKRDRENEPVPAGPLGDPPERFTEELAAIWEELAEITPAGVLTISDRWLMEMACELMCKLRIVGLTPKVGMSGAELSTLLSCLSRLGLTPADRTKVGVHSPQQNEEPAADPWQEFSNEFTQ